MAKRPLDVLHGALNARITLEVRGGREYRGTLDGYDHPHMNLVLTNVEEVQRGQGPKKVQSVIVRGDSIVYIAP